MKRTISQENLKARLDYDPETGIFTSRINHYKHRAGCLVGCRRSDGYIIICIDRVTMYAHRLAWLYMTGKDPVHGIDHRNLNPSDNRWENLRESDQSNNMANVGAPSDNASGYKGASLEKRTGRWKSQICVRGKQIWLGYHDTPEQAHEAYANAAREHFGEYARLA